MTVDMFIIDAFCDAPLGGNPAAVCPLRAWLPEATLQAVAREMNQSETVFFVEAGEAYDIRWFTPTREVDMIGHATLAAGHLVLERLRPDAEMVLFRHPTSEMTVARAGDGMALDMPALAPEPIAPLKTLASALGREPSQWFAAKHYLCVFEDEAAINSIAPDMAALARLDLAAVIVTAPARPGSDHDFVSRFFAPANGVPEDPVSGVAHCCLTPYWANRLGKTHLTGRQLSQRGGMVRCDHRGDRVTLSGAATIVLEGTMRIS